MVSADDPVQISPSPDSKIKAQLTFFFGFLFFATAFGLPGGVATLPVSFYLKDRLHSSPESIAWFQFVVGLPVTANILFGFARDRWRHRKLGDRAYFLFGAPPAVMAGLWAAFYHLSYTGLLAPLVVAAMAGQFVGVAVVALMAETSRKRMLTGWMGAFWAIQLGLFGAITPYIGGLLGDRIREALIIGSVFTAIVFIMGFWRARAVFGEGENGPAEDPEPKENLLKTLEKLLRHRPLWMATLITFLWYFTPATGTSLLFHFTVAKKISEKDYGLFLAVTSIALIPTSMLYARLCKRFAVRPMLLVATVFAIPQWLPLLLVETPKQAMVAAVLSGIMGGFANAGYLDLFLRCCPKKLEGTAMTIGNTVFNLGGNLGNVAGAWIYTRQGFLSCEIATTAVYAMILPVLLLIPRFVMDQREGQPQQGDGGPSLAEIARS